MRKFHLLAFALIFTGGMVAFNPAFAFSTLAADRGVDVSVAGENKGLIELTEAEYNTVESQDTFTTVASVENNLKNGAEINYRITTNSTLTVQFDGQEGETVEGSTTVLSGEGQDIGLRCPSGNDRINQAGLTVEITATSDDVSVQNIQFQQGLDVACSPGNSPPGTGPPGGTPPGQQ
ncbi:hypothetical protein NP511_17810 [Natrinema thermotolerans]|uniref:Uncharacterized protein n=1 Tax=Natrinema thermotolerans TaxID=121872 RepID=A0AAF0SYL1_9EURY|nr:hypothetical protein [Natrinema thermotolerans]WMT07231.1 hypothetical protein NP511_17810 [Natrinema thermotolerans]